jgi:RimJ/RimL family protein N-acetyltransferase
MSETKDLSRWAPRPRPQRKPMEGRYARLEPLDVKKHGDQLFECSNTTDAERLWQYTADGPYRTRESFEPWLQKAAASDDPLMFVVIDKATGKVEGRQTYLRITPDHGVIEIGYILWGPKIGRTRVATEAFYLFIAHAFDDLGYRRYEWKCDNANVPSKNAAERFGYTFEGIFRQHMIYKGRNRDTAWYSILDGEWPKIRRAFEDWLAPENFDSEGRQKTKLNADVR